MRPMRAAGPQKAWLVEVDRHARKSQEETVQALITLAIVVGTFRRTDNGLQTIRRLMSVNRAGPVAKTP